MLAVLFPGQGSQSAGLLTPWLDLPGAADRLSHWSGLAGLDLLRLGTTGTAEQIRDTAVAQPLLAATALLTASAALGQAVPGAVCGHSIGELPALAVAGVLSGDAAVEVAALRGSAMAGAAALAPTGMAAVLGGDADEVLAAAAGLGLAVATVNVTGQVVLGGPVAALDRLAAEPPAGARIRRLDVAGAFHTAAMEPARDRLGAVLSTVAAAAPLCKVVANADGAVVAGGRECLDRLTAQVTHPVRFDLCLRTLRALGVTGVLEVAPGGTLVPIAKRALPGAEILPLRGPEDLAAAHRLVAEHAAPAAEHVDVHWRLLSAPDGGVVDLLLEQGQRASAGQQVAVVTGRTGSSPVAAPFAGTVQEWLVHPGDPVRAGQPLAVLA